ncbi:MAG: aspartate aminotransferase family protein [Dehalococcoidia bacterium]
MQFPEKGMSIDKLRGELTTLKSNDMDWKGARAFSMVFRASEEVSKVVEMALGTYVFENGLSPFAFPSLLRMETEVISMTTDLLHGGAEAAGNMTSGGTESIIMAVKAARDYAREKRPEVKAPEMVIPRSAHPAFNKAAYYLGIKVVIAPTSEASVVDLDAYEKAFNSNTIFAMGSAFSYPHGMIDPIEKMAAVAAKKGVWFHVDSCVGGFILPFIEKLGYPIPPFDFRVPGVMSMSADVHKYGYIAKGASTITYRNGDLRKYQLFVYTDWNGGVYATPAISGARSGGPVAAAWSVMKFLGREGYMRLAKDAMEATRLLMDGIKRIPGLYIVGDPPATTFAVGSDTLNIYALGDAMKARGWNIDSQHMPPTLHFTVSPMHLKIIEPFFKDFTDAVKEVSKLKQEDVSGEAAVYGMIGSLPDRAQAKEMTTQYFNDLYRAK